MISEPPWPLNERARLDELKSYGVLDTPPEELFDRITRLVARYFGMPIALISLVDETRQWFKSRYGLEAVCTDRRLSFCAYAILENRVMVVPDASKDERFADNELVTGPPYVHFYAGAPLTTPGGFLLGTLCVVDREPHYDFGPERQRDLVEFSRLVTHDLEARRAMAAVKKAKAEAQQANSTKTHFMAAASHDLRQPIQAASLYAGLMGYRIKDPETRELLGRLQASIDGLNGMLGGLLDLSRLEAGVIVPELTTFATGDLLARLTAEFRAQAETKGIDLRYRSCAVAVRSDVQLLERVLRNLLSNAVTHTSKGRILLACRRRGDHVEFQVWDTGPGIAEQHREIIFQEFRQLHNPERAASQGFGLGLAIVHRIAGLLGLRVTVRSVEGRGSVFSVFVPLAKADPKTAPPTPAPNRPRRFHGHTVLMVEDDDAVRLGLTMLLELWGLTVVTARTLDELAELLVHIDPKPRLLISDYRLPNGRTGREAVEMVRRRWNIPAIIITGDTAPERLHEAMAADCHLLHKPVELKNLALALDEAIPRP